MKNCALSVVMCVAAACAATPPRNEFQQSDARACISVQQLQSEVLAECNRRGVIGPTDSLDHELGLAQWRKRVLNTSGSAVTPKDVFEIVMGGHYEVFAVRLEPRAPGQIQENKIVIVADARDPTRIAIVRVF
jgi:hypothetical protein